MVLACVVWPVTAALAQPAQAPPPTPQTGSVTGRVTYAGPAPSGQERITRDREVCGTEPRPDEALRVDEQGGLAGVVVSLDGPTGGPPPLGAPDMEVRIAQCRFTPRVKSLTVGSTMFLHNQDALLHRPTATIGEIAIFQWAMPLPQRLPKRIRHTGRMELRCKAHPWERAWVAVFPHPHHTVTDATGHFRSPAPPAGSYTVTFWHERLGELHRGLVVEARTDSRVDLTYQ